MTQPITIEYEGESGIAQIKFHAVVEEDHGTQSQITKYPVQSGFEISDHAIRKNRNINLKGIFTNTVLSTAKGMAKYDTPNTPKKMFETMESLVQSGTVCTVNTNLGTYHPVIFVGFNTPQKIGHMDSIHFTMKGEEVQVAGEVFGSTPIEASFTEITGDDIPDKIKKLEGDAVPYPTPSEFDILRALKKAEVRLGEDFLIPNLSTSGKGKLTTYKCVGYKPWTGVYDYEIHQSVDGVFEDEGLAVEKLFGDEAYNKTTLDRWTVSGGAVAPTLHEFDQESPLDTTFNDGKVLTYLGRARETQHGFAQEVMQLGGTNTEQPLGGLPSDLATSAVKDEYVPTIKTGKAQTFSEAKLEESVFNVRNRAQGVTPKYPTKVTSLTRMTNPRVGALYENTSNSGVIRNV